MTKPTQASTDTNVNSFKSQLEACHQLLERDVEGVFEGFLKKLKDPKGQTINTTVQLTTADKGKMDVVLSITISARDDFPYVIVELKTPKENLPSLELLIDQVIRYVKQILYKKVSVKAVNAVISNGRQFYLRYLEWLSYSQFELYFCKTAFDLSRSENVRTLINVLTTSPITRSTLFVDPVDEAVVYELLQLAGLGGSSIAYIARPVGKNEAASFATPSKVPQSDLVVLKIFKKVADYSNEMAIFRAMKSSSLLRFPIIRNRSAGSFGYIVLPVMRPVIDPPFPNVHATTRAMTYKHFLSLALQLKTLHKQGIVHGDIRPANIMFYNEEPCFIDFGFAKMRPPKAEGIESAPLVPEPYAGTIETASNRILKELGRGNIMIAITERDDVESLFKCFQSYFMSIDLGISISTLYRFWHHDMFCWAFEGKESADDFFQAFEHYLVDHEQYEACTTSGNPFM